MDHATTTQSALTLGAPVGRVAASWRELSGGAVHLWQASLAPDPATSAELAAYLTGNADVAPDLPERESLLTEAGRN